jgi:hypothetical protein
MSMASNSPAADYREAHDAVLNAAFDAPAGAGRALPGPWSSVLSSARRRRAPRRSSASWWNGAPRRLRSRRNASDQRAEAGRPDRRQREAALRDQYGPEIAARIELDGTYALVRYRGRLLAARDRIVTGIDPPAVGGLRTRIGKRRLAGWELPPTPPRLRRSSTPGSGLVAECRRVRSELSLEGRREVLPGVRPGGRGAARAP